MDHTQATETQAAERYLLGELPAGEAEDFERHYFECADCAEAVEAGDDFIAHAKVVLAEHDRLPARDPSAERPKAGLRERLRGWWSLPMLVPAGAALVLAVVTGYQGFVVIPGLESPRALPAFQLAGASRGTETQIRIPAGTAALSLAIDVPPDARFPQYLCVLSARGRTVFQVTAPSPSEGQPITILVPGRTLASGDYEFTVYGTGADGQPHDKVTTSSFHFQSQ